MQPRDHRRVDGAVGQFPASVIVNYEIRLARRSVPPLFTAKKLLDELYLPWPAPQGIQPGMLGQANIGLRVSY